MTSNTSPYDLPPPPDLSDSEREKIDRICRLVSIYPQLRQELLVTAEKWHFNELHWDRKMNNLGIPITRLKVHRLQVEITVWEGIRMEFLQELYEGVKGLVGKRYNQLLLTTATHEVTVVAHNLRFQVTDHLIRATAQNLTLNPFKPILTVKRTQLPPKDGDEAMTPHLTSYYDYDLTVDLDGPDERLYLVLSWVW